MVNDAKIQIFSSDVNCDRYHLLRKGGNPSFSQSLIVHTEEGKAFNGFNSPYILNCSYEDVIDSRYTALTINGINNGSPQYYMINSVTPIRVDKCMVELEYDVWMNDFLYGNGIVGKNNTLFETTKLLEDYPFREFPAKFKYFSNETRLCTPTRSNVIITIHDSEFNVDRVFIGVMPSGKRIYLLVYTIFEYFTNNNVDTNSILNVSVSPFDVPQAVLNEMVVVDSNTDLGYNLYKRNLLDVQRLLEDDYLIYQSVNLVNTPYSKSVILGVNNNIVWQCEFNDAGSRYILGKLIIEINSCKWVFKVSPTNTLSTILPDKEFTIECFSFPFFSDYYQYYMNLERSFNNEKRQAQLDKQVIDGIGDAVASTLWHGTSSGAPAKGATGVASVVPATSAIAMGGAAVGSAIQIYANWYSTNEYNKKLDSIENRQARLQYDKINATNDSPFMLDSTKIYPRIAELKVDDETVNSRDTYGNYLVTYNCRIDSTTLNSLINGTNPPIYISGDFEFLKMSSSYATQLNQRFKNGVEFVSWT